MTILSISEQRMSFFVPNAWNASQHCSVCQSDIAQANKISFCKVGRSVCTLAGRDIRGYSYVSSSVIDAQVLPLAQYQWDIFPVV